MLLYEVLAVVREKRTGVFAHPHVHLSHPHLDSLHFIVCTTSFYWSNERLFQLIYYRLHHHQCCSTSSSVLLELVPQRLCVKIWRPPSASHLSVQLSRFSSGHCGGEKGDRDCSGRLTGHGGSSVLSSSGVGGITSTLFLILNPPADG